MEQANPEALHRVSTAMMNLMDPIRYDQPRVRAFHRWFVDNLCKDLCNHPDVIEQSKLTGPKTVLLNWVRQKCTGNLPDFVVVSDRLWDALAAVVSSYHLTKESTEHHAKNDTSGPSGDELERQVNLFIFDKPLYAQLLRSSLVTEEKLDMFEILALANLVHVLQWHRI